MHVPEYQTALQFRSAGHRRRGPGIVLQFVRKISGFTKPSKTNEAAFDRGIDEVAAAARRLMDALMTNAPARDRGVEAAKAKAKAAERFGIN